MVEESDPSGVPTEEMSDEEAIRNGAYYYYDAILFWWALIRVHPRAAQSCHRFLLGNCRPYSRRLGPRSQ